jgi:hypothetical protein
VERGLFQYQLGETLAGSTRMYAGKIKYDHVQRYVVVIMGYPYDQLGLYELTYTYDVTKPNRLFPSDEMGCRNSNHICRECVCLTDMNNVIGNSDGRVVSNLQWFRQQERLFWMVLFFC